MLILAIAIFVLGCGPSADQKDNDPKTIQPGDPIGDSDEKRDLDAVDTSGPPAMKGGTPNPR